MKNGVVRVTNWVVGINKSIIEKSAIKIERYSYLDHFIFELVEDTNGYYYGREILTNLLFPLTEVKDERKNVKYYRTR